MIFFFAVENSGENVNNLNRFKRAVVLSGFCTHEILKYRSEQMKRPCLVPRSPCLHSSFLICAQDLWMSVSTHVAAAVIIQHTTCGWQRGLDWSEVRRPPGPRVQCRQRARRDTWKTECMSQRGGGGGGGQYARQRHGDFPANRSSFSDIYCIRSVSLVTQSLLAWLAWGQRKWPGLK